MKSNKQITKYFLALAGISLLATTAFAQSISDADLKSRLDYALRTRQTKDGKSFGFPSSSEVLNATKGKSGKFTIDTGDKEENVRFQKAKASGGVIVGSGADGLVAQSNLSANGDIVVIPPIEMNMSVTVVGGTGSYCVTQKPIESTSRMGMDCLKLGEAKRILKPGRYLLTLPDDAPRFEFDFLNEKGSINLQKRGYFGTFIDVAADEHKIVPLRKITVPYVANHKVYHRLTQSIGNEYYQKQLEQFAIGLIGGDDVVSELKFTGSTKFWAELWATVGKLSEPNQKRRYHLQVISRDTDNDHSDAYVYYVLPGVYQISWRIDSQSAPSTDVYVE